MAQMVKESACNAEDSGLIPGWEDPLEKEMATHSSTLAWRIPWTEYFWVSLVAQLGIQETSV